MYRDKGGVSMRLSERILQQFRYLWIACRRFPLVLLALFTISVLSSIRVESPASDFSRAMFVLVFAGVAAFSLTFLVENRDRQGRWRLFVAIGWAIAVALYAVYISVYADILKDDEAIRIILLSGLLLLLSLFLPSVRREMRLDETFLSYVKAFFTTAFFVGIAFGGVFLILAAVGNLLFPVPGALYEHIAIWVWYFLAPAVFLAQIPPAGSAEKDRERAASLIQMPGFFRVLLSYILIPLSAIYSLVLLAYVVKTWVTGDPDNLLLPMIIAYCVAVILLFWLTGSLESRIVRTFRLLLPKIMAILALYEVVRILIDLPAKGIDRSSYFVLLLCIYSSVFGILSFFIRRDNYHIGAIVLCGFLVVSVLPPVDFLTLPVYSQTRVVENLLQRNNMRDGDTIVQSDALTAEEKEQLRSSVQFLFSVGHATDIRGVPAGFDYYEDFEKVFGIAPYETVIPESEYTYREMTRDKKEAVDIGGYDVFMEGSGMFGPNSKSTDVAGTYVEEANSYTVEIHSDTTRMDLEITDSAGKTILLAHLLPDIQDLFSSKTQAEDTYVTLPTKDLTFTYSENGLAVRVIYQDLNYGKDGDGETYNAQMLILVRKTA